MLDISVENYSNAGVYTITIINTESKGIRYKKYV